MGPGPADRPLTSPAGPSGWSSIAGDPRPSTSRPNQTRAAAARARAEWESTRNTHERTNISRILATPDDVWRRGKEATHGRTPWGDAGTNMQRIAAR